MKLVYEIVSVGSTLAFFYFMCRHVPDLNNGIWMVFIRIGAESSLMRIQNKK